MASFAAKVSSIKINEWFFESKCFKLIENPSSDALSRYLTSGYLNHCAADELG